MKVIVHLILDLRHWLHNKYVDKGLVRVGEGFDARLYCAVKYMDRLDDIVPALSTNPAAILQAGSNGDTSPLVAV